MPDYDESPTTVGHDWYCNACPFTTPDHDRAVQHVVAMKTSSPYAHHVYERRDLDSYPVRCVAPESSGIVNTARVPARKRKPAKKK